MTNGHSYSVRIKRSTEKEMDGLPISVFDRVVETIRALEIDPRPHGSRKLRGLEQFRLRVPELARCGQIQSRLGGQRG